MWITLKRVHIRPKLRQEKYLPAHCLLYLFIRVSICCEIDIEVNTDCILHIYAVQNSYLDT